MKTYNQIFKKYCINSIVRTTVLLVFFLLIASCKTTQISYSDVGLGWANNSINTVKFRKNALTTFKGYQFISYYDGDGFLVLGKRKIETNDWTINKTSYKGNTSDAHNDISIAIDGAGFLHVSWDHHNTKLRYAKSKAPFSLVLGKEQAMTGSEEAKVTYPEFYNLPNGNLLFFYRSGSSGRGNMVINSYDLGSEKWTQIQENLIDGEEKRSAYWQACVDTKGTIHVSWVWRESWDVATNHDMCYAKSIDGGLSWQNSNGIDYNLPIKESTAEIAWRIPQNSSLINQTAITTDDSGNPFIASYWRENKVPQFQIVYRENGEWKKENSAFRKTAFNLGGGGTKKIPISRPEILVDNNSVYLLFRDEERGNKISLGYKDISNASAWKIRDISKTSVGQWEPNYDIALWQEKKELHVFSQEVIQVDGEGLGQQPPTQVQVLQVKKLPKE